MPPSASSSSIPPDATAIPVPNNLSSAPPGSSTSSGPQSLPHPTQRALLLHLQNDPATIPQLSDTLTTSLASNGWPDRVRALALELLRSGTCTNFPDLFAEVLRRAKMPPPSNGPPATTNNSTKEDGKATSSNNSTSTTKRGSAQMNGVTSAPAPATLPQGSYGADGLPDVRIPLKTVEAGVAFLKARVRDVVEIVEPEELEERGSSDED